MSDNSTKWLDAAANVLHAVAHDLEAMITSPSINPPGNEGPVASYFARRLAEMGA